VQYTATIDQYFNHGVGSNCKQNQDVLTDKETIICFDVIIFKSIILHIRKIGNFMKRSVNINSLIKLSSYYIYS
jgi:hypothetical protein